MNGDKYISPRHITQQYDVSSNTLIRWADQGKIRCIRPGGKSKRLYHCDDIKKIFGASEENPRKTVCYARVSSHHQREDLLRQKTLLGQKFPDAQIVEDIASGLNWNRSGFQAILERLFSGDIETIVVTYRDRLCRFGFELVEWFCSKVDAKIVVIEQDFDPQDKSRELAEDLLSIITVFTARNNGLRAAKYKKERGVNGSDKSTCISNIESAPNS